MTAIRDDDVLSSARSARGTLQRACLQLLRQVEAAGELPARPTSSRFIYYQLKQAGYPLKRHEVQRDDQDVIDAMKYLRDVGPPLQR